MSHKGRLFIQLFSWVCYLCKALHKYKVGALPAKDKSKKKILLFSRFFFSFSLFYGLLLWKQHYSVCRQITLFINSILYGKFTAAEEGKHKNCPPIGSALQGVRQLPRGSTICVGNTKTQRGICSHNWTRWHWAALLRVKEWGCHCRIQNLSELINTVSSHQYFIVMLYSSLLLFQIAFGFPSVVRKSIACFRMMHNKRQLCIDTERWWIMSLEANYSFIWCYSYNLQVVHTHTGTLSKHFTIFLEFLMFLQRQMLLDLLDPYRQEVKR